MMDDSKPSDGSGVADSFGWARVFGKGDGGGLIGSSGASMGHGWGWGTGLNHGWGDSSGWGGEDEDEQ